MQQIFADRHDAGAQLAEELRHYAFRHDVVVVGIAPGGMPVAWEVRRTLGAPLDVLVVQTVGAPRQPELAIGEVASGGISVLHRRTVTALGLPRLSIDAAIYRALSELRRREAAYRRDRMRLPLAGRVVIIVDDGFAARATMRAAVHAVREDKPARIVVALPVGTLDTCTMLQKLADEIVCPWTPRSASDVVFWYRRLSAINDDEVRVLLRSSGLRHHQGASQTFVQWDA